MRKKTKIMSLFFCVMVLFLVCMIGIFYHFNYKNNTYELVSLSVVDTIPLSYSKKYNNHNVCRIDSPCDIFNEDLK